jgi:3-isopropylmalate/(R)-2-methylmalate dehydratase small subunit
LLTGTISEQDVEKIWSIIDASPGIEISVDLNSRTATIGETTVPFEIDEYTRWRLLEGLDDIGLTLRNEARITDFESRRESWRPKTLPVK